METDDGNPHKKSALTSSSGPIFPTSQKLPSLQPQGIPSRSVNSTHPHRDLRGNLFRTRARSTSLAISAGVERSMRRVRLGLPIRGRNARPQALQRLERTPPYKRSQISGWSKRAIFSPYKKDVKKSEQSVRSIPLYATRERLIAKRNHASFVSTFIGGANGAF